MKTEAMRGRCTCVTAVLASAGGEAEPARAGSRFAAKAAGRKRRQIRLVGRPVTVVKTAANRWSKNLGGPRDPGSRTRLLSPDNAIGIVCTHNPEDIFCVVNRRALHQATASRLSMIFDIAPRLCSLHSYYRPEIHGMVCCRDETHERCHPEDSSK
jgi:hypothetical protein